MISLVGWLALGWTIPAPIGPVSERPESERIEVLGYMSGVDAGSRERLGAAGRMYRPVSPEVVRAS